MADELSQEAIRNAIAHAKRAEALATGRKEETYLAVLLATLLRAGPASIMEAPTERVGPPHRKRQVIGELFAEKKPSSEVEKVVAAGYYIENVEGVSGFNVDDLQRCFVQAKEKTPGNLNDAVYKGIKKGWMAELPEKKEGKKAWQLTRTGEETVAQGFESARRS